MGNGCSDPWSSLADGVGTAARGPEGAGIETAAARRARAAHVDRDPVLARLLTVTRDAALRGATCDAGLARTVADARDLAPRRARARRTVATEPIAIADEATRHARWARRDALVGRRQLARTGDAAPARGATRRVDAHAGVAGRHRAHRVDRHRSSIVAPRRHVGGVGVEPEATAPEPDSTDHDDRDPHGGTSIAPGRSGRVRFHGVLRVQQPGSYPSRAESAQPVRRSGQIEHEDLGVLDTDERKRALATDRRPIARRQPVALDLDRATRHLDPRVPLRGERVRHLLARPQ
jgi:hypothetical protein